MHPHADIISGHRRGALQGGVDRPNSGPSIPTCTGELKCTFAAKTEPGQRKLCRIPTMLLDGMPDQRIDPFRIVGLKATHPAKLRTYHEEARHERRSILCVPAG